MCEAIAVFITAPNSDEAARLADMLISSHLAACVQILPEIQSVYFWKGNIERQTEVLLIAKTLNRSSLLWSVKCGRLTATKRLRSSADHGWISTISRMARGMPCDSEVEGCYARRFHSQ